MGFDAGNFEKIILMKPEAITGLLKHLLGIEKFFTQGGTNDRLAFSFAWIASVGSLDATLIVTDTDGNHVSQTTSFPDNGSMHERFAKFSDFSGDAGMSLESVDKLEIRLNTNAIPNTDFAVDSITIVPEPASWSLLAIATLAFAVYRRRRRSNTTINP